MAFGKLAARLPRAFLFAMLVTLPGTLGGCTFHIDYLVPHHANAGDLLAVRTEGGSQSIPHDFRVMFSDTPSELILKQTPEEVVVEIPSGLDGEVSVSFWAGPVLVSNTKRFRIDAEPIVYRILGFGDSLMGPRTYHTHRLDNMLNENVGPSLVINEGKAGETISEGAQRLGDVLSIHYGVEYMYILEGANDVTDQRNTPLGQMLSALEQMIDTASAYSITPVLLTLPPRTAEALFYDQTWPTTADWNNALRDYAVLNGIEWVDLHQAFVDQPEWESFLDEFGLHLSEQGQEFVAQLMYPVVASLLE
jgi:lysophospholipase L1-like esterase